jgi:hypothetical protein
MRALGPHERYVRFQTFSPLRGPDSGRQQRVQLTGGSGHNANTDRFRSASNFAISFFGTLDPAATSAHLAHTSVASPSRR